MFASTPALVCHALGSDFPAGTFTLALESVDGSQLSALQSIDSVSGDVRTPLAGTFSICDGRNPSGSAKAGNAQSDKAAAASAMRLADTKTGTGFDRCMAVIR